MMRSLFLLLIAMAASSPGRASLLWTLSAPTFSGMPGDDVDITGTLLNPDPDPIFVNNLYGFLASPDLDFDFTDFFTLVPGFFNSGDTYSGPIVTVDIDGQASPGTYFGSITLQGGSDINASDDLVTQNFQVVVSSGVPEPLSAALLGGGLTALVAASFWCEIRNRARTRRHRRP